MVERLFRAQESVVKGLTDRIEELEEEAMLDADHESFQDEEDSNTRDRISGNSGKDKEPR